MWVPVYGSSNIVAVDYNEGLRQCYVRFTDGTVYTYEDVSPETYKALLAAPSKGKYVNYVLRRGYKYRPQTPDEKRQDDKSGGN